MPKGFAVQHPQKIARSGEHFLFCLIIIRWFVCVVLACLSVYMSVLSCFGALFFACSVLFISGFVIVQFREEGVGRYVS